MNILEWIDFGKVAAERDSDLKHYFYDNGVIKKVVDDPSAFLILGRKGAGKTALFRFFEESPENFISSNDRHITLSLEDYNWNVHSILKNSEKASSMVYKQSWKLVILIESLKLFHSWFENSGQKTPKKLSNSFSLVSRIFGSPYPSTYEVISNKIFSLTNLKLPSIGASTEGDGFGFEATGGEISFDAVKSDPNLRTKLSQNIDHLISVIESALSELPSAAPRVFILFDRVDEAWDEISYDATRPLIGGLVSAADGINAKYKGTIRPIVFLREDIFGSLSVNDTNKLNEDCGALLHWRKDSIVNMALTRINYFAKQHGKPEVVNLDEIFDRAEMRQRSKPTNYLLRRTMMRPRDMISLLSRIKSTMSEKANSPFAEESIIYEKLECESVYEAESGYSVWLRQEVTDEWKVQKPIIIRLLEALQNNGSTNITRDDLSKQLASLNIDNSSYNVTEQLIFLFNNSIIGFKVGESKEWRYKCFYPSQTFLESPEYRVHDGLVKSLNLKEPREKE